MQPDGESEERARAWAQLMRSAQAGDRPAYERLLREITPFVRALARRRCTGPHDAEEIVQDTLLTVHRVRHTYDPERPFMPWLAAIAQRRGIDALRRRRRVERHEVHGTDPDGPGSGPEAPAHPDETFAEAGTNEEQVDRLRAAQQVGRLLERLPARQREAVESLKLKEMSLAEASAASGQSVGALKVNVHRAVKTLRRLFQEQK
ncbi:MAG TPA: sigma-70 family RNA polymerase sigma factor [Steroidobacteraceae bacterium]|nr:sigma-70 family RNA polymerase sigma factor [Steroidobacteraceae bacterium]